MNERKKIAKIMAERYRKATKKESDAIPVMLLKNQIPIRTFT